MDAERRTQAQPFSWTKIDSNTVDFFTAM